MEKHTCLYQNWQTTLYQSPVVRLAASPVVRLTHLQGPMQQAAGHALVVGLAPQEDCSTQAAPHKGRRPPGIAGQGAAQDGSPGQQVVYQLLQTHCLQAERYSDCLQAGQQWDCQSIRQSKNSCLHAKREHKQASTNFALPTNDGVLHTVPHLHFVVPCLARSTCSQRLHFCMSACR